MGLLLYVLDVFWSVLVLWLVENPLTNFVIGCAVGVTVSACAVLAWQFVLGDE